MIRSSFISGIVLLGTLIASSALFPDLAAQDYVVADFTVSDSSDYNFKSAQLSVSQNGDMAVFWETSGSGAIWYRTIHDHGTLFGEQKQLKSPYSTMEIRLAHADSGNFMVIYGGYAAGRWTVLGQVFDQLGNEISDTLTVQRNSKEMIRMNNASIFSDGNNTFAVLLPGADSLMVERFDGFGEFSGNTMILKPEVGYIQSMTGLMTRSGEFILVWIGGTDGGVYGQRYTAEGNHIGEIFQVSQSEPNTYDSNLYVAQDSAGNFAIAWTRQNGNRMDIKAQLFDKEAAVIGTNTNITDENATFFNGAKMSMDMDDDGKCVLAWSDKRDSDTSFIYIQQVDNQGELVGGNYRATTVNNQIQPGNNSIPTQVEPTIRILRDTIYLTWINHNQDQSIRSNVFANIQKWKKPDLTSVKPLLISKSGLSVYPNPTTGFFTIRLDEDVSGPLDIEIYNTVGKLVHYESNIGSSKEYTIHLYEVPSGVYYLKATAISHQQTIPLIITE